MSSERGESERPGHSWSGSLQISSNITRFFPYTHIHLPCAMTKEWTGRERSCKSVKLAKTRRSNLASAPKREVTSQTPPPVYVQWRPQAQTRHVAIAWGRVLPVELVGGVARFGFEELCGDWEKWRKEGGGEGGDRCQADGCFCGSTKTP